MNTFEELMLIELLHKSVVQQYTVDETPRILADPAVHEVEQDPVDVVIPNTVPTDF